MKALTVQQPWAWAIVHGRKDVENRTQAWSHRGTIAVHAGMRISERGMDLPLMRDAMGSDYFHAVRTNLTMGAVIGLVDLVGAHVAADGCCESPWGDREYGNAHPDFDRPRRRDIVHLELDSPRSLAEPVPCRGALGLWTLPPDVLDQVLEELVEATS